VARKPLSLKGILSSDAMQQQFAAALPKHLTAERFTRVAITALTRTPKLQECTQESFFKTLLDLSAMGLEPDGRRAHLIPYGKECTLVIDYKGLVELVRRSGDVAKIHADVVCENDTFEHSMGEVTVHTYDLKETRGEPYAAYAQVTLKDGSVQAEIMSKADIEKIRSKSRAGKSGPWVDHWSEMAKKTAFRRLTKWLTLSPEIQERIAKADEHEFAGMRNVTPETKVFTENPFRKKESKDEETAELPEQSWEPADQDGHA
jgi:recombination protein RecT